MMLRVSVEMTGNKIDMNVVTGDTATIRNSIDYGDTLVAFSEALVGEDDDALDKARSTVIKEMGTEALIDAAALVGNFQRMVRIANSTGIPLDTPMDVLSEDMQEKLGFDKFVSAANTPDAGLLQRAVGKVLRPVVKSAMWVFMVKRKGKSLKP